jgi:hypothetical protein
LSVSIFCMEADDEPISEVCGPGSQRYDSRCVSRGGQPEGARASGDDEAARQASGRKSIFTFATMPCRAATASSAKWPPLAIAASWSRHR